MSTPHGAGPRRIQPGDDLGAVFGTHSAARRVGGVVSPQPPPESQPRPESQREPESKREPESQPQRVPQPQSQPERVPQPQPQSQREPQRDPEPGPQPLSVGGGTWPAPAVASSGPSRGVEQPAGFIAYEAPRPSDVAADEATAREASAQRTSAATTAGHVHPEFDGPSAQDRSSTVPTESRSIGGPAGASRPDPAVASSQGFPAPAPRAHPFGATEQGAFGAHVPQAAAAGAAPHSQPLTPESRAFAAPGSPLLAASGSAPLPGPGSAHRGVVAGPQPQAFGAPAPMSPTSAEPAPGVAPAAPGDPAFGDPVARAGAPVAAAQQSRIAQARPAAAPARARPAAAPEQVSPLAVLGLSRTIAWSLVLGVATLAVAALPVPVLNVPAAVVVALGALVTAIVGLVRGPRTAWGVLVAIVGVALAIGGVGSAFPIALAYIGAGAAIEPLTGVLAGGVS